MLECSSRTRNILTIGLLFLAVGVDITLGVIIPPHWANDTVNPCARKSWQMIHWPNDNKCYNIFSQGPCGETQELFHDASTGAAACRCSRGSAWHSESQRCYPLYSKGPCKYREYYNVKDDLEDTSLREEGGCKRYEDCPTGQLFWPPANQCFSHLSRGPCLHGHLLHIDPETGSTKCGCDPTLMSTNYWPHSDSCHELYTRGPCIQGHIFLYNLTAGQSECVCNSKLLTNYHAPTGRCYETKTLGPCRQGQEFSFDSRSNRARCVCLEGYVEWLPTGHCYRIYTRGPCLVDHFLHPSKTDNIGECVRNTCSRGELYDPGTNACYSVGRRGPCQEGKLWVFERATSIQGSCQCDPHLIGYWEQHGICYELGEMGPCPKRRVLTYDKQTGELKCRCDLRRGYIPWVNGRCIIAGVKKEKLVPVAVPMGASERGNSIPSERIHRGLTLPLPEEPRANNSTKTTKNKIPTPIQHEILKDILNTIHNVSFTKTSTSISAEISRESIPSVSIEVSAKNILQTSARKSSADPAAIFSTQKTNATTVKEASPVGSNDRRDELNERLRLKLEEIKKRRQGLQTSRVPEFTKRKTPLSPGKSSSQNNQDDSEGQINRKVVSRRMVPHLMRRNKIRKS